MRWMCFKIRDLQLLQRTAQIVDEAGNQLALDATETFTIEETVGGDLLETEQERTLYLVGDHNIVGLEDAYLTGVHAAGRIVAVESREPATKGALAPSVR